MGNLPWNERVPAISINPDMATRHDIARLAAELMEARNEINLLKDEISGCPSCKRQDKADLRVRQRTKS